MSAPTKLKCQLCGLAALCLVDPTKIGEFKLCKYCHRAYTLIYHEGMELPPGVDWSTEGWGFEYVCRRFPPCCNAELIVRDCCERCETHRLRDQHNQRTQKQLWRKKLKQPPKGRYR